MSNPLILKLQHGADLTDEDRAMLESITARTREVGPREDLIREGDKPEHVRLVLEGFAFRYKMLPDGQRQITGYLVPGDFCDLHVWILGEMDHSIGTLTRCTIVEVPGETINELTARYPRIARALWWATLVEDAVTREALVGMGQRPADRQLAHFLCELLLRLQAVGRASETSYEFPVTQEDLGDTLGLSTVHVNRTLQKLRDDGLITLRGKALTIPDPDALKRFAGFNPNYLHLRRGEKKGDPRGNVFRSGA
ncbi:MAG TPA: Crp/Fnr family transcriptional regulator [Afifellaceae bacterium]|nr:Crp/Fnr family transcriptional regulator [Afifellaceae bacterium]